jgi:penicillin-binding protein 1C
MTRRRKLLIAAVLMALPILGAALSILLVPYPIEELTASSATSLRIVDRDGRLLRQLALERGGRAEFVPLSEVPPLLVLCTLHGEDRRFYEHPGVDGRALLRALWLNLRAGRLAYGGSTITMQLVRLVSPHRRSLLGKLRDVQAALRLERALPKAAILEQYLNRAYYGNGAYGVMAAAQLYFGKPAGSLSDGEAALLAVLPRAPSAYDPYRHLQAALSRRRHVLGLLHARGVLDRAAVSRIEATKIVLQQGAPASSRPPPVFRAPHFVDYVLAQLPPDVRAAGGTVRTTLDLLLQERLQHLTREHIAARAHRGVRQAGVVVLEGRSGAILGMIGSPDYFDSRHGGQINITTTPRHPGSALKPFTYALALERGDTPATIAWDVIDGFADLKVRNADQRQHGPVRYRTALACSYNLSALHVAERVGPGRLLTRLRQAGLETLTGSAKEYGPLLTLGAGPVRLLDLAAAYGFLINGGLVVPPHAMGGARSAPRRLFDEGVSWLVMDMLADPAARRPAFGDDLPFDLPYRVAAKTGTSGGFSDNVAVIATREYLVAAWAGNFDGPGLHGVLAMAGAAPLARAALLAAAGERRLTLPERPPQVIERPVCVLSGQAPGPHCPTRNEHFLLGAAPQRPCTWHRLDAQGRLAIAWPDPARRWAERRAQAGGRALQSTP